MGQKAIEDLLAFQLAQEYKRAVYALVRGHPRAENDFRFRGQLFGSASGIEANLTEGYHRQSNGELRQFVRYAMASAAESQLRIRDGVERGFYSATDCEPALRIGARCRVLIERYYESLRYR